MKLVSFKIKNLGLLTMIFLKPNQNIGRLLAKAGKLRNTILGLLKR
jgi:hypothetical protein